MDQRKALAKINEQLAAEGQGNRIEQAGASFVMRNRDDETVYTASDLRILWHFIIGADVDPP
jgi:hypothetical protein